MFAKPLFHRQVVPMLIWACPEFSAELLSKVARTAEATLLRDLADCQICFRKQFQRVVQAHSKQIVDWGMSSGRLEKSVERLRGHINETRQILAGQSA